MSRTMSRRQFVRAGAGVAALTYVGGVSNAFGGGFTAIGLAPGGHPTILPHLLGVQHFSVRDATARLEHRLEHAAGSGADDGPPRRPDYPADPTDLGPLVPLPGGFAEVFEYLASVGVAASSSSSRRRTSDELGRQPTAAEIRSYLDNARPRAQGTHQFGPATST